MNLNNKRAVELYGAMECNIFGASVESTAMRLSKLHDHIDQIWRKAHDISW